MLLSISVPVLRLAMGAFNSYYWNLYRGDKTMKHEPEIYCAHDEEDDLTSIYPYVGQRASVYDEDKKKYVIAEFTEEGCWIS